MGIIGVAGIGGILMIGGAINMYRGNVFVAGIFYLISDVAWIYLGISSGDIQGTIFIIIGTLLGLGTFLKMNFGKMRKTLHWED